MTLQQDDPLIGYYEKFIIDFWENEFLPKTKDWDQLDLDVFIGLLVKYRNHHKSSEIRSTRGRFKLPEPLIEAGLTTGWTRENPLLRKQQQQQVKSLDQDSSSLSSRKSLVSSALGNYSLSRTRGSAHEYRSVKDAMTSSSEDDRYEDPIVGFDENHVYNERSKMIQNMLDSPSYKASVSDLYSEAEIGSRRTMPTHSSKRRGPDGITPTFMRDSHMIGSQAVVRFF